MMDSFRAFFKSVGSWVGQMTPSQVMMLFGVVAGSIVGIILMVGWLSTVDYARLYSNISDDEAGEIITFLEDSKIPYELADGGRTILVPSDQVYKTRISLASSGLPRGGSMGYSIFDQNNLGMTDFLQNLNFRRALEGELTRTIMQLAEVSAARVHIVIPKDRLFKEDQKDATASVVLKLRGNNGLSKSQLAGITHLVAASVEGLTPSNITIVDYSGDLLTSGRDDNALAGLSSSQLEVRKQVESYLENKSESMLDGVLGSGKAVVRVTADLNFQQIERTSETFDANAPSIRSEERVKSSNSSADKADENSESSIEDNSETTVTNYELNKTVEHIVNAIGTIERLSVAVMIDGTYAPVENDNGDIEMIYEPRTQEELDRLASIVKSSIGFNQQRNDQIEVLNIGFDRKNLDEDREFLDQMYMRDFYMEIARKVGYFLLIAFLFLYFRKKARKLFTALSKLAPPTPAASPRNVVEQAAAVEEQEEPVVIQQKRAPTLTNQMQETAKKQPEEIAKAIRTMMVES